jgi:hypothetical protein
MRIPYNVKTAFSELLNIVFLLLAAIVFLTTGSIPVLLATFALEFGYMLFLPGSQWYRGILTGRATHRQQLARAEMKREILPALLPQDRNRFLRLEAQRNQIPSASAVGFGREEMGAIYGQMDVLLDKFLNFASKSAQYRAYLVDMVRPSPGPSVPGAHWVDRLFDIASGLIAEKQTSGAAPSAKPSRPAVDIENIVGEVRKGLDSRVEQMKASLDAQISPANKQVVAKNLEILTKRRERIGELGEIITNLECQLDLIESTFGLISDQVRSLAPEQILHEINDVVLQTETTTQLLAASAPMEYQFNRLDKTLA